MKKLTLEQKIEIRKIKERDRDHALALRDHVLFKYRKSFKKNNISLVNDVLRIKKMGY